MKNTINGLFSDSERAGEAVSLLKEKGYTKDISILARDERDNEIKATDVKKDISEGTLAGATTGAAVGALAAVVTGLTSLAIPGIGAILLGGPLYAGLAGAATGALAGGMIGALVELGVPEETARMYEESIQSGEVLVSVSAPDDKVEEVASSMRKLGAHNIEFVTV